MIATRSVTALGITRNDKGGPDCMVLPHAAILSLIRGARGFTLTNPRTNKPMVLRIQLIGLRFDTPRVSGTGRERIRGLYGIF